MPSCLGFLIFTTDIANSNIKDSNLQIEKNCILVVQALNQEESPPIELCFRSFNVSLDINFNFETQFTTQGFFSHGVG